MTSTSFTKGTRVVFKGWEAFPPRDTLGTVRGISEDVMSTVPLVVHWDNGAYGCYSVADLRIV